MNTQLVDSIVQMIGSLPTAERDLVKQRLSIVPHQESVENTSELTLSERIAFLKKPLAQRQSILAKQAEEMFSHYESSTEWRELMMGDIIDDYL